MKRRSSWPLGVLTAAILLSVGLIIGVAAFPQEKMEPASSGGWQSSAGEDMPPKEEIPESKIPVDWLDEGLFAGSYEKAYERMQEMSLAEKVGQMFLVRCPAGDAVQMITQYHPGGFVLFGRDFDGKSKEAVQAAALSYQEASEIPMILAVDEEGGTVVRVSGNPKLADHKFLSPQELYQGGGLDAVRADAAEKDTLLKELGINLNLAPVADVSTSPSDYINARTLGKPVPETAEYVSAVVTANRAAGMASALKHFPGYGNNVDTHTDISVDERSYESFRERDFLPFQAGIKAGAETVLVSHNVVKCIDADRPASLSPEVHRILREDLGYTGLIMTDDLAMRAILKYTGEYTPAVAAVRAGNDLMITTDYESGIQSVLQAVENGSISQELVDRAVFHILAMKYETGILQ